MPGKDREMKRTSRIVMITGGIISIGLLIAVLIVFITRKRKSGCKTA